MTGSLVSEFVSANMRPWRWHLTTLIALCAAILIAFHTDVSEIVETWWVYPTYSHGFLIIPISAWLVWEARGRLARLNPRSEPAALIGLLFGLLGWWLGALSTTNELRQFSLVLMIVASTVAVLGWQVFQLIWFPTLYLFFLVPTGQYFIAPMQAFATTFTDHALSLLAIPHYTHGTMIELTTGRFEIAEACAGLRFLIATVALGTLIAYLNFRKWYKVVLFLLACVVVPLIANALRVVGIILLAHYTNNAYGAGADHIVYGWVFNVAILLVLALLATWFRDGEVAFSDTGKPLPPFSAWRLGLTLALALTALLLPYEVFETRAAARSPVSARELVRPLALAGWTQATPAEDWKPDFPNADGRLFLAFEPKSAPSAPAVELYVAVYGDFEKGHVLTSHINHLWPPGAGELVSTTRAQAQIGEQHIKFQEMVVSTLLGRRLVWSSYWVDDQFTDSSLRAKLLQIPAALSGRNGEAIVVVSTSIDGTENDARDRLSRFVAALSELPRRLEGVRG